jgi:ABC-2 type transport system ATP-binding protein
MSLSPEGSIELTGVWKRFHADRSRALLRDKVQHLGQRLKGGGGRGWRWVLRDVNLSIAPGEAVGLIGTNGSGKSTLLKILTQVMYPYAGRVDVRGRVGALIEVRAGIHPDLTGRENIYLYGTLLGLPRRQVAERFDDIVAFAELEQAVDRQVKFYSSGMQMRLGFAVAAFLEPDILLVDEVLAVGDSAFQQKCLERMRTVLEQGTTLVLVTHDLSALEAATSRGIWLRNGQIAVDGPVRSTIAEYRDHIEHEAELAQRSGPVRLMRTSVQGVEGGDPRGGEPLVVTIEVESDEARRIEMFLGVSENSASPVFTVRRHLDLPKGTSKLSCVLDRVPIARGHYALWGGAYGTDGRALADWQPLVTFHAEGEDLSPAPRAVVRLAPVVVDAHWELS